ncbi:unnamed protein product, partial [Fusarium fujikuroi]
CNAGLLET